MYEIFVGICVPNPYIKWITEHCNNSVFYEFRVFEDQNRAFEIKREIQNKGEGYLNGGAPIFCEGFATPSNYQMSNSYLLFDNQDEMIVFILIFGDTLPKEKPIKEKYGSIQRYTAVNRQR